MANKCSTLMNNFTVMRYGELHTHSNNRWGRHTANHKANAMYAAYHGPL